MKNLAYYNWLLLAITSLLVGVYITIFENIVSDKGYLYFIMAVIFGLIYYRKRKKS